MEAVLFEIDVTIIYKFLQLTLTVWTVDSLLGLIKSLCKSMMCSVKLLEDILSASCGNDDSNYLKQKTTLNCKIFTEISVNLYFPCNPFDGI